MSLYYTKYLKYKNKYFNLKNQIAGSAKKDNSFDEKYTVNNLLEELIKLVYESKQSIIIKDEKEFNNQIRHLPQSDIILQSIFRLPTNKDLNDLYEFLNFINLSIAKKNIFSKQFRDPFHIDHKRYNSILSRIQNLIVLDNNIEIDKKCLLLSIKKLQPNMTNKQQSEFGLTNFDKYIYLRKKAELESRVNYGVKSSASTSAAEGGGGPDPDIKTTLDWTGEPFNISEKHFNLKDGKGGKCSFRYSENTEFYDIIFDALNNLPIVLDIHPSDQIYDPILGDIISYGSIIADEHIFKLKIPIYHNGIYCNVDSNSSALLDFISKNKQLVQQSIEKDSSILSNDNYVYNYEQRRNIIAFKLYKKINSKIYTLLNSNNYVYKSIKCKICNVNTTGPTNPIRCYKCRTAYCTLCNERDHSPNPCHDKISSEEIGKASEKASDKYFEENITKCPVCTTPLFRSEACAHLVCSECKKSGSTVEVCDFCEKQIVGYEHITNGICEKIDVARDGNPLHYTKKRIILRNKFGKTEADRIEAEERRKIDEEEAFLDLVVSARAQEKAEKEREDQVRLGATAVKPIIMTNNYVPLQYQPKGQRKIEAREEKLDNENREKAIKSEERAAEYRAIQERKNRYNHDSDDEFGWGRRNRF
jgi:hypothetical protein